MAEGERGVRGRFLKKDGKERVERDRWWWLDCMNTLDLVTLMLG